MIVFEKNCNAKMPQFVWVEEVSLIYNGKYFSEG